MTQINLLPWREEARQRKKIEFGVTIGAAILLVIFLSILVHFYLSGLITTENNRIAFLQNALTQKGTELNNLKDKKKKQLSIETELGFLYGLKAKSYNAVRLMNELETKVPGTITLEKLTREKNQIHIEGEAQSELQITLFMKNLGTSVYFTQPTLTRISETKENVGTERSFEVVVDEKGTQ